MTALPVLPTFRFISQDAVLYNSQFIPNRQANTTPSLNWVSYPSGSVPNSTTSPIPTFNYAAGPDGVAGDAQRIVFTTTGASFQLLRNVQLPIGTYMSSVFVRATDGTGPWTLRHGYSAQGYITVTNVTDQAWTELVYTRTTDGVSNTEIYSILGSGTNTPDILLAHAQIRDTAQGPMPNYRTDVNSHPEAYTLRKKTSYPGSMPMKAAVLDMTGGNAMSHVSFTPNRIVTDFACGVLFKLDTASGGADYVISHPTPGLFSIGVTANGDINALPLTTFQTRISMAGQGWHWIGSVMQNGFQALYFNGVQIRSGNLSWAGLPVSELLVGGTTTATAVAGQLADVVWVENQGANAAANMTAMYKNMKETAANNGIDVSTKAMTNFLIAEGDSTVASATSWAYLVANSNIMTPNLPVRNYAQSGQNMTHFIAKKSQLLARIDECVAAGITPVVGIVPSYVNYRTQYAANTAAVLNDLWALTDEYRSHGSLIMLGTPTPMLVANGYATIAQEAARQSAMVSMRNATDKWDCLADFGGDPEMGDPNSCAPGSLIYEDDKHPNANGNLILAGIAAAALKTIL